MNRKKMDLRAIFGSINERDEYQQKRINSDLAGGLMGSIYLLLFLIGINLFLDNGKSSVSFSTICLALVTELMGFYIIFVLRKNGLDNTETYSESDDYQKRVRAKQKAVFSGITFCLGLLFLTDLVPSYRQAEVIQFSFFDSLGWLVSSILVGSFVYAFLRMETKKEY